MTMISIVSLMIALIGINAYEFLEDKISIPSKKKNTLVINEQLDYEEKKYPDTIYVEVEKKVDTKKVIKDMTKSDSQITIKPSKDTIKSQDTTSLSAPSGL